jgi:AcrR family transcriptional regulator
MALERRTRQQVLTEFRTAEILSAASAVFGDKGFAAATVEDIARAAGVAKGTVYLYFPSKAEICRAAFARNVGELRQRAVAAITSAPEAASAIRAFATTKLAYFQEHLGFFAVYRGEAWADLGAGGALQSAIAASSEAQIAALADVLEAAIATGEVRPVPTIAAAQAVFDLTRAVIERRLRGDASGSSEDEAALVADLLWKGLAT